MNHLPHLIQDLGLVLIVAGLTTLLFKRLKQPVVLGYILAGLLVGPQLTLLPSVTEIENIKIWAEIVKRPYRIFAHWFGRAQQTNLLW